VAYTIHINGAVSAVCCQFRAGNGDVLLAWCSGNAFDPINEVTVRRARLVLQWVTASGQVNHLGM